MAVDEFGNEIETLGQQQEATPEQEAERIEAERQSKQNAIYAENRRMKKELADVRGKGNGNGHEAKGKEDIQKEIDARVKLHLSQRDRDSESRATDKTMVKDSARVGMKQKEYADAITGIVNDIRRETNDEILAAPP